MTDFDLTGDVMIEQAIRGDSTAFSYLYGAYAEKIFRHVVYRVPDKADAEDITQEVFVRAWRAVRRYQPGKVPFISWLMVIARNLVADFYRVRKNNIILDETTNCHAANIDLERDVDCRINIDELRLALSRLKKEKQKVLTMHFIEEMSYPEMSRVLGKSEGALRVAVCRALVELKDMIDPRVFSSF